MSLTTINPMPVVRTELLLNTNSFGTTTMSASDTGVATFLLAPKAGNISHIGYRVNARTGTVPTYRFSIQGTTTTHTPDGTIKASGSAKVDVAPPATGWVWSALDAPAVVATGDSIAVAALYLSGTIDASNNFAMSRSVLANVTPRAPYFSNEAAGVWTATAGMSLLCCRYDDGYVPNGLAALSAATNNAFSNASTPKYRGNKWTPPFGCRVIGAVIAARLSSGANFKLDLFTGTNSSPTASTTVNSLNDWLSVTANDNGFVPLEPTVLTAGTDYRFIFEPTTSTNITTWVSASYPDANSRKSHMGDLTATSATTAGTWTDVALDSYMIVPVIDQIDVGGGIIRNGFAGGGFNS